MKKISLLIISSVLLLSLSHLHGQIPAFKWAEKAGGSNFDMITKAVVDTAGNTYVTGECRSTPAYFGSITLPSAGGFIAKYGPTGTVLWAKKAGTSFGVNGSSSASTIELDAAGNIYVTGNFLSGFVVGNDTLTTATSYIANVYIAKYNSSGIGLWAKKISTSNWQNNLSIRLMKRLNAGSFVVTGYAQYVDTIENIVEMKYPGYFIATVDGNGNFTRGYPLVTDTAVGGEPHVSFDDIATNNAGNIYLSGYYGYTRTEIDTTHWNLPPNPTAGKAYIAKFDSSLTFKWAKANDYSSNHFWNSNANNSYNTAVTADDNDNVYQTGEFFADTMYYDTLQVYGWNTLVQNFSLYVGGGDIYLVKLNGAGNVQWLKSYESNNDEYPTAICSDKISNVYITGVCVGSTNFGNVSTGYYNYGSQLFVVKVSATGDVAWLQGSDGCTPTLGKTIGEDGKGNVIVAGVFNACDPTFGNYNLIHYPYTTYYGDMFIAQIGDCKLPAPTISASAGLTWCGTDSVVLSAQLASQYLWNTGDTTQAIIVSGSANRNVYVSDSVGCYAKSNTISTQAYPLPLASVIASNNATSFCIGDSAVLTGNATGIWNTGDTTAMLLVKTAGVYYVTDSNNCGTIHSDSIIINVNALPALPGITSNGVTLQSSPASTYQWYLNGTIITAATLQSYTPSQDGIYNVQITDSNGCSSTSAQYIYLTTIINNSIQSGKIISISPNPFTSETTITFGEEQHQTAITVTDEFGRFVVEKTFAGIRFVLAKGEMKAGIYFVRAIDENRNIFNGKIVLQ